ncbi:hypothetical protein ACIQYS_11485 [Psychrobacillus sp. NPDC096426]|uniref:hypothetical protein n=1 Tax=Psychrobacillus sp. NPDC096426 TaxID=3364491 RepID=UPI0038049AF1
MIKRAISVSFVLLLFFLIACENDIKLDNRLSEAKLTDREKFLLSSTSDQSFVFDFHTDKKYKQVSVWIDKYEFGKLTEENIGRLTTDIKENGIIIFSSSKISLDEETVIFNINVGDDHSSSKITSRQVLPTANQSTWGSSHLESIPVSDHIVLATNCYANGNGMSTLSTEFYSDMDSRISELENYDVVYVLRSEFHK